MSRLVSVSVSTPTAPVRDNLVSVARRRGRQLRRALTVRSRVRDGGDLGLHPRRRLQHDDSAVGQGRRDVRYPDKESASSETVAQ